MVCSEGGSSSAIAKERLRTWVVDCRVWYMELVFFGLQEIS